MKQVIRIDKKVYIPDVPRMSWDTGEMCEFASAFVRAVSCLGHKAEYDLITGITGAAFRFVMDEAIWNPGNYGIQNFTSDPLEPAVAAGESVGRGIRYVSPTSFAEDRTRIVASVSDGMPVVAFGVVGPSDAVVITGVDDDGDTLLGWSTFQDIRDDHDFPHDPTGYFRKPEWHQNLRGYLLFERVAQPVDSKAIITKAIRRISQILDTRRLPGRICGAEALAEWETVLRNDDYFSAESETMRWRYLCFTINTTMLLDQLSAPAFLEYAAEVIPDCAKLIRTTKRLYLLNSQTIRNAREAIPDDFSSAAQENLRDTRIRKKYAGFMHDVYSRTLDASEQINLCVERLS